MVGFCIFGSDALQFDGRKVMIVEDQKNVFILNVSSCVFLSPVCVRE